MKILFILVAAITFIYSESKASSANSDVETELADDLKVGAGIVAYTFAHMAPAVLRDQNFSALSLEFCKDYYDRAVAAAKHAKVEPQKYNLWVKAYSDYSRNWAWVHFLGTIEGQAEVRRQALEEPERIRSDEINYLNNLKDIKDPQEYELFRITDELRCERLRAERSGVAQKACEFAKKQMDALKTDRPEVIFAGPLIEQQRDENQGKPTATGTAFFITQDGYLVTKLMPLSNLKAVIPT